MKSIDDPLKPGEKTAKTTGQPLMFIKTITALVVGAMSSGCLKPGARVPETSEPSNLSGYATGDPHNLWTRTTDGQSPGRLEVCWDRTSPLAFPAVEGKVAQHVSQRFKTAGLTIEGWQDCPANRAPHVKPIRWENRDDMDIAFANGIGYRSGEEQLPILLGTMGKKGWCPQASSYVESNCLLNVVVHEFGHVFGLHHELNRPDVKDQDYCKRRQFAGEQGTIQLGSPDRYSVMNYCRLFDANRDNLLLPLSFGDLLTLKALYRGPMAFIQLPFEGDQEYMAQFTVSTHNLPIKIFGKHVEEYQFRWASVRENCHPSDKQWSAWIPTTKGIGFKDLPRPVESSLYKPHKLCVVGKKGGKEQPRALASSIVVTFDKGESSVRSPF